MRKRTIALILFGFSVGLFIWWLLAGAHVFTMTSRLVQVKDDLFGTTVDHWEKAFIPGLDILGPAMLIVILGGVWLLYRDRKKSIVTTIQV